MHFLPLSRAAGCFSMRNSLQPHFHPIPCFFHPITFNHHSLCSPIYVFFVITMYIASAFLICKGSPKYGISCCFLYLSTNRITPLTDYKISYFTLLFRILVSSYFTQRLFSCQIYACSIHVLFLKISLVTENSAHFIVRRIRADLQPACQLLKESFALKPYVVRPTRG